MKYPGRTKNHRKTVERMWHMANRCKEMDQEYTVKIVQDTLVNITLDQIRMN